MKLPHTTYHQRGKNNMPNNLLPYKYEVAGKSTFLTSFAGLPVFMDFLRGLHFDRVLRQELDTAEHADCLWKPSTIVTCLLLLNLAGGDNVDDLQRLQADPGMSRLLDKFYEVGLCAPALRKHRDLKRRQTASSVPAASTVFRFLKYDGLAGLEERGQGKAYIPSVGQTAEQLCACNKQLISALCANRAYDAITLDMDATLIETHKRDALYGYKGFTAYQPMNVWWAGAACHVVHRVPRWERAGKLRTEERAGVLACLSAQDGQAGIFTFRCGWLPDRPVEISR